MLNLNDIDRVPHFLSWWLTQNVYKSATCYLLGMDSEEWGTRFSKVHWVRSNIRRNSRTHAFAQLNRIRYRVLTSTSQEQVQQLLTEAVGIATSIDVMSSAGLDNVDLSATYTTEQVLEYIRQTLICLSWFLREVYPECVYKNALYRLLIGDKLTEPFTTALETIEAFQAYSPGAFSTGVLEINAETMDIDVLRYVCTPNARYAAEHLSVNNERGVEQWLYEAVENFKCMFTDPCEMFIDGENCSPTDFGVFMRTQAWGYPKTLSKITLVDTERSNFWNYIMNACNLKYDYHAVKRIIGTKSRVDFELSDEVGAAYRERGCRTFWILSSDSDFALLPEKYPDAQFHYVVIRKSTSTKWLAYAKELPNVVIHFLDSSCYFWNSNVLCKHYLEYHAIAQGTPSWQNDDDWEEFLRKMGFKPTTLASRLARCELNFLEKTLEEN